MGFEPQQDNFRVKQTLLGAKRLGDNVKNESYPLTPVELLAMYGHLNMLDFNDRVLWCVIIVAFRCLLRKCHYTPSPHILLFKDLSIMDDCISLKIRSSKTDQFGEKPFTVFICRIPGSPLCPYNILQTIINRCKPRPMDPIFKILHGKELITLPYAYVNKRLKSLASLVDIDPSLVSTHSLRHGGATFLNCIGMPMDTIKSRGNWTSRAVDFYIHPSAAELYNRDVKPAEALSYL